MTEWLRYLNSDHDANITHVGSCTVTHPKMEWLSDRILIDQFAVSIWAFHRP